MLWRANIAMELVRLVTFVSWIRHVTLRKARFRLKLQHKVQMMTSNTKFKVKSDGGKSALCVINPAKLDGESVS